MDRFEDLANCRQFLPDAREHVNEVIDAAVAVGRGLRFSRQRLVGGEHAKAKPTAVWDLQ